MRETNRTYHTGNRYSKATKEYARRLRFLGKSFGEIAQEIHIAESTAHLWTKDVRLTDKQKKLIDERRKSHPRNKRVYTINERVAMGKRLAQYREKYTDRDLLKKIVGFFKKHGRIPLKRELPSRAFRQHFGSWNNAIRLAGFEPNPELFAKRVTAHDGHVCDSFAEKIIDDWLADHQIPHTRNVPYHGSKMTADFFIASQNLLIEFFGLKGVNRKYDDTLQRKFRIIRRQKLKIISLFPEDLLKEAFSRKLGKIFNAPT